MQRGTTHTPEARARMSATRKGKPRSPEHCAALSAAIRARNANPTPEMLAHRERRNARRAEAMRAHWATRTPVLSDHARASISAALTGRTLSEETRARMAASARLRWQRHRAERAASLKPPQ